MSNKKSNMFRSGFLKMSSFSFILFYIIYLASFQLVGFAQSDFFGNKIVSDSLGNTYIAGNFKNSSLSFGDYYLKNNGGSDIFLAKYNSDGKIVWAKNIGGAGDETIVSLKVDYYGNINLSGSSTSEEINFENSQLKNNNPKILFNVNVNNNGNTLSSKIEEALDQSSGKKLLTSGGLYETSGNDTTLSIISPQAGDIWKVGTKGTIKWNSENVVSVLIELSTDYGETWKKVYTSSSFDFSNEYDVIIPNTPSDSCLIRISDYYNPDISDTSGIFSISGILHWEIKQSAYNSVLKNVYFLDSSMGWAVGLNGLIRTTNKGETWSSQLTGYGLLDIFFLNDHLGWTVGLNGTIFKTVNGGGDWTKVTTNYNYHFEKVYFADEYNGYMIAKNFVLKTTDGGGSWVIQQPTDHILQTMFFINKDTGWVAGNEGVILKTTNGGSNWVYQQMNGTTYGTLISLYFLDENTGWASGSGLDVNGGVILKTTDGGVHWDLQHNGFNRFIYSVFFTNSFSGWAVGDEGIMFNTTDGGADWELQGSGTFADLYSVSIKSYQSGWSVGNDGAILKYINTLNSDELPVELTNFEVHSKGNKIELNWLTATEINNKGFEVERKTSNEWNTIGFIIGKGTTTMPSKYSYSDDLKNVSCSGNILYRLKQIDYDGTYKYTNEINVNFNSSPEEYSLMQNYPNPFNPSTIIKYSVRDNSNVILKVYDILGREVATLINEEKSAGTYTINFDSNKFNLASGTYFYTLRAGDFVQTKKMLLVK
jgi:photosystem II stability/assembly factor-like uncharacterized protein